MARPMGGEWFCLIQGRQYGPFSTEQLVKMARQGRFRAHDRVRVGDAGPWISVRAVRGLLEGNDINDGMSSAEPAANETMPAAWPSPAEVRPRRRPAFLPPPPHSSEPTAESAQDPLDNGLAPLLIQPPDGSVLDSLKQRRSGARKWGLAGVALGLLLSAGLLTWMAAAGWMHQITAADRGDQNLDDPGASARRVRDWQRRMAAADLWRDPRQAVRVLQQGDYVQMRLGRVTMESRRSDGRGKHRVYVQVDYTNLSHDRMLEVYSGGREDNQAVVRSSDGHWAVPVRPGNTPLLLRPRTFRLRSGQTQSDLMVFDIPSSEFSYLHVLIPLESIGVDGDLAFRVPRDQVTPHRGLSTTTAPSERDGEGDNESD